VAVERTGLHESNVSDPTEADKGAWRGRRAHDPATGAPTPDGRQRTLPRRCAWAAGTPPLNPLGQVVVEREALRQPRAKILLGGLGGLDVGVGLLQTSVLDLAQEHRHKGTELALGEQGHVCEGVVVVNRHGDVLVERKEIHDSIYDHTVCDPLDIG